MYLDNNLSKVSQKLMIHIEVVRLFADQYKSSPIYWVQLIRHRAQLPKPESIKIDFSKIRSKFLSSPPNESNQTHQPQSLKSQNPIVLYKSDDSSMLPIRPIVTLNPRAKKRIKYTFDLHGFTKRVATPTIRRLIINLRFARQYTIDFIVGQGIHSTAQFGPVLPTTTVQAISTMKLKSKLTDDHFIDPTVNRNGHVIFSLLPDPLKISKTHEGLTSYMLTSVYKYAQGTFEGNAKNRASNPQRPPPQNARPPPNQPRQQANAQTFTYQTNTSSPAPSDARPDPKPDLEPSPKPEPKPQQPTTQNKKQPKKTGKKKQPRPRQPVPCD